MLFTVLVGLAIAVILSWKIFQLFTAKRQINPAADIAGKNVVVTGASAGIGRDLAEQLAGMGANVFVTARRATELKTLVNHCRSNADPGAKFGYTTADMSNADETKIVIQRAVECLGGIDFLFLNHAHLLELEVKMYEHSDHDFEEMERSFHFNFFSYVRLIQHAMPQLKKSRGRIGITNSVTGRMGSLLLGGYSASKHALDGFSKSLNKENKFNDNGITITNMFAGAIATAGIEGLMEAFRKLGADDTEMRKSFGDTTECAKEIIRATTLRQVETYYPPQQWLRYYVLKQHLFPDKLVDDW